MNAPLVMIEWVDSHATHAWTRQEVSTSPLRCRSVGWLLHDGPEAKTIAPHMSLEDDPQRCGEMTIPACAVVKVRVLR